MDYAAWIISPKGAILHANESFCSVVRLPLEKILSLTPGDIFRETASDKWIPVFPKQTKTAASPFYEGFLGTREESSIPVFHATIYLPEKTGVMGIFLDTREIMKQESIYQKLIEHMNEGVWMCDKNDCTTYANPKFCEMLEYSLPELKTMKEYELWDKETANRVKYINTVIRPKGISSSYEGTFISKSGKKIPVLLSGTPLPNGEGTMGMVTNLSDMKKQETLYRKLVEHMNEGVWMCDKKDYTIYANPKFCEMVEYSLEELKTIVEYDLWDEKSAEYVRWINKNVRKEGQSTAYEGTLISKRGKRIPVLLSGTPLPNGEGTMGMVTDLRELKKKESMYKTLIENLNEPICLNDKNEKVVYANPKFCEIMGCAADEIVGKSEYQFWDEETHKKVHQVNMNERKQGISSHYEGNLITKTSECIPVLVSGSPLPDGGTLGVFTDLRVLKQKQETEQILSKALQYTTDAIIVFSSHGIIKLWNRGAKIIFGYKKEEIEGFSIDKLFPKESERDQILHPKVLRNFEVSGQHKNKNLLTISATLTPIENSEDGEKSSYALLIARDISQKTKLEEEMTLKYQKIKEAYNQFGIVRRQLDYVFELLDTFRESQDIKTVSDFIVSSIIMLTKADACILRYYNPKLNRLELGSYIGVTHDWKGNATISYENSLLEKAFTSGMPLKIIDIMKEPKYKSTHLAKKNNLSSLLLIPLKYKSQLVGGIWLYARPDKKLEIFDNEFIEKYAQLIEIVVGSILKKN